VKLDVGSEDFSNTLIMHQVNTTVKEVWILTIYCLSNDLTVPLLGWAVLAPAARWGGCSLSPRFSLSPARQGGCSLSPRCPVLRPLPGGVGAVLAPAAPSPARQGGCSLSRRCPLPSAWRGGCSLSISRTHDLPEYRLDALTKELWRPLGENWIYSN